MRGIDWNLLAGGVVALVLVGCNSGPQFEFDALDFTPPPEELVEFPLGEYRIPISVPEDHGKRQLSYRHRFQIDFQLFALVSPAAESHVADAWVRHEGKIRDQVIRVCRNATIEELQEPELATLKSRLMHALAAPVGEDEVRQLLITEVVSREM